MARAQHIVGIDLGTTNCAVAYVDKFDLSSIGHPGNVVGGAFTVLQQAHLLETADSPAAK